MGQSQIDVVAAQKDVVADRHALDLWRSRRGLNLKQAEIGSTAADIYNQDVPIATAIAGKMVPQIRPLIVFFEPAIEGCLRLLQQADGVRKAGFVRRGKG